MNLRIIRRVSGKSTRGNDAGGLSNAKNIAPKRELFHSLQSGIDEYRRTKSILRDATLGRAGVEEKAVLRVRTGSRSDRVNPAGRQHHRGGNTTGSECVASQPTTERTGSRGTRGFFLPFRVPPCIPWSPPLKPQPRNTRDRTEKKPGQSRQPRQSRQSVFATIGKRAKIPVRASFKPAGSLKTRCGTMWQFFSKIAGTDCGKRANSFLRKELSVPTTLGTGTGQCGTDWRRFSRS
jgi:hypothetical protein